MSNENNQVTYTDKTTIKNWFKTGLKPKQDQFWAQFDSFWHKSESLPISSITNLGDLLDGKAEANHTHSEYAKNDATSLTAENVTAWQQKLGVADLKFDDQAITITQDYTDFGLVAGDSINAFNNAIYSEVAKKLDAPTENATNGYVLMADGSVIAKSEFGKVDKVMGVAPDANKNVDISGVGMNWTHAQHRFSGIPKVSDATYNLFPVFDNNRNLAYAENPYQMLKNGLGVMTQAQALELGQLLGGGTGSAGAMSVNLISPPIVQNRYDSVEYIYLRGANLKLNSASRKIEIINTTTNQVVLTIPNAQIVSESDFELTFWYNFKDFPLGDYKIRLTSGAKIYTTDWQLKIVQSVTDVDFNNLTWDIKTKDGYTQNTSTSASGGSLLAVASTGSETTFPVLSIKSSELFVQGEDFYIELQCNITVAGGFYGAQRHVFGIGYTGGANENLYLMNVGLNYTNYSGNINVGTNYTSNNVSYIAGTPYANTVIIIKTGNLFRVISRGSQESITLSYNSGYSIFAQMPASPVNNSLSVRIVKAFKLN